MHCTDFGNTPTRSAVSRLLDHLAPLLPLDERAPASTIPAVHTTATAIPTSPEACSTLAAAVYRAALQALPASVRSWYASLRDRGLATKLERYTAAAHSTAIVAAELDDCAAGAEAMGTEQFSVRASRAAREVVSALTVEDGAVLEMAVRLPTTYPLKVRQCCVLSSALHTQCRAGRRGGIAPQGGRGRGSASQVAAAHCGDASQ